MKKPLIGITPQNDPENCTLFIKQNYFSAVTRAGGIPLLLPLREGEEAVRELAEACNAFLFSGGPDPHPSLYGEDTLRFCGTIDPARDAMELSLARLADSMGKAVLGICRGMQVLNTAFGGTLYQDIAAQSTGVPVQHYQNRPYVMPVHMVRLERDSLLYSLLGREQTRVNSMHHQAVRTAAPGFRVCARASDGIAEAMELPGRRFFLAVQWHPEYLDDDGAKAVFSAFVAAAGS